jgi:hypothetical protein
MHLDHHHYKRGSLNISLKTMYLPLFPIRDADADAHTLGKKKIEIPLFISHKWIFLERIFFFFFTLFY